MCIEKNDLYLLDVVFLTHDAELVWTCHWEQQKYSFVLSVASSENIGWSYEDGHCLSRKRSKHIQSWSNLLLKIQQSKKWTVLPCEHKEILNKYFGLSTLSCPTTNTKTPLSVLGWQSQVVIICWTVPNGSPCKKIKSLLLKDMQDLQFLGIFFFFIS